LRVEASEIAALGVDRKKVGDKESRERYKAAHSFPGL
jgi:hypothetical protein